MRLITMVDGYNDEILDLNKHLAEVVEELHGTESKWKAICIQLNIEHQSMVKIQSEHKNDLEDCNREMIIQWLKTGEATWYKLAKALKKKSVGMSKEAESIERKYNVRSTHDQSDGGNTGFEDVGEHSRNECHQERLSEILEWLLKMGFDIEDIQKWIDGKKAATIPPTPPSRPSSTNGKSSSKGKSAENRKRRHSKSSRRKQPKPKRSRLEESETSIGGEASTTRRRTSSHRRLKSIRRQKDMQTILTKLKDEKSAEEFIDPVDKERAEDYYEHIDKPMWLNEMKRKVERGDYSNMKQFRDDFELIIKNCHDYNAPDHEVIEQADQLEKRFCKLIEDLPDESDSDSSLEKLPSDAESSDEEHEDSEQSDHSEEDSNSEASEDNDASLDISYSCPTDDGDD